MDILLRTLDRHSININVRDEANGDTALLLAAKGNNSKVGREIGSSHCWNQQEGPAVVNRLTLRQTYIAVIMKSII